MRFAGEDGVQVVERAGHRFTPGVWQTEIFDAVQEGGMRAHRFFYRPGAHSHWHTHDGEQAIFVLAGRGFVARWGEDKGTPVGPGDWVHVEPGEKHWHGAAPDDVLVHVAVTATGGTQWHEALDDDAYAASVA